MFQTTTTTTKWRLHGTDSALFSTINWVFSLSLTFEKENRTGGTNIPNEAPIDMAHFHRDNSKHQRRYHQTRVTGGDRLGGAVFGNCPSRARHVWHETLELLNSHQFTTHLDGDGFVFHECDPPRHGLTLSAADFRIRWSIPPVTDVTSFTNSLLLHVITRLSALRSHVRRATNRIQFLFMLSLVYSHIKTLKLENSQNTGENKTTS